MQKDYTSCLDDYLAINKDLFDNFYPTDDYLNENSMYYYIVRRNFRAGLKLRYLHHFFKTLRLLRFYNYFFFNKRKKFYRFYDGLSFDNSFIEQYDNILPTFSLRLDNEYRGKHKTKRKYIYSIFLKRKKSRLFELALCFNRISYKYKYRHYSTRLSIILFNFFFYFDTVFDKICALNQKIYSLQRKGGKVFISFNNNKLEINAEREIKVQLCRQTLSRLKIRVKKRVDQYYNFLIFKYRKNLNYLYQHSMDRKQIMKYTNRRFNV